MREAIGTLAGMAAAFVIGWMGRGRWERYPWNAKPRRWQGYDLDAEVNEADLKRWETEMRER